MKTKAGAITRSRRSRSIIARKVARVLSSGCIRTLDLFAGAGGLSLGFERAGFRIVGALESDQTAVRTYARNLITPHIRNDRALAAHMQPREIERTAPTDLVRQLQLGDNPEDAVDVLIGGPPCQAFARVGRAKLREIHADPEAFLKDSRASLYRHYLKYVRVLRPIALVMENVPDLLNLGGRNIAEEICEALELLGYRCAYTLLNAVFYGVPQMRERMFLVGYADVLGLAPAFPKPTHWTELPSGYRNSRSVALQPLRTGSNGRVGMVSQQVCTHYVEPPAPSASLEPAVTAGEALKDLPPVRDHLMGRLSCGVRRFAVELPYRGPATPGSYAWLMRKWPGHEGGEGVRDQVIRYLPRDYDIFRRMRPGDQYPQAYQIALDLFEEQLSERAREGRPVREGSSEYWALRKATVPPYDHTKFPNKWRKMEADRPARTLMAHLGKDSYTHIHYDSCQARTISVREAARLQSFPDGFLFEGAMNAAFRQIGNAVPPLLACALATEIRRHIMRHATTHC